ncbi:peptidase M20 [Halobacillus mangrovi]|uniref:Peptidase M20 n=2 Tax=Halobacillus mangrovi TaxID=402384 RepID=A0A1W5ZZC6_9BACI|nr:amidohydrolase [Halobacillus mangrovi]ARI78614.1 peptidase M20 [Halobacillus mangrovi]
MSIHHEFIQSMQPKLVKWRRHFHRNPELGFMEYETTYAIGKELEALGFTLYIGRDALKSTSRYGVPSSKEIQQHEANVSSSMEESWLQKMNGGHTGLAAVWDTGRIGDHLAFRFDIDALPIEEKADDQHLPYKEGFHSQNPGVMHACGHDGHTAIGLGLAHFIATHTSELNGKFTFLFQPAEEGGRGAKAMTDKGWLNDVDYFYSGHIGIQDLPLGTVAASTKGFLASSKWNVTFKGQSSHAGMKPEDGRNALLAAATAATQLYAIPRHSEGVSRVNVGKLTAGNGRNIISDYGYIELETRGETKSINDYMQKEASRMIRASADMHHVESTIDFVGETEPMVCDDETISTIKESCGSSSMIKHIINTAQVSGSEDASFMMNVVQSHGGKATYMLFGTRLSDNHHSPAFDYEEEVLPVALDTYIHIVKGGHSLE